MKFKVREVRKATSDKRHIFEWLHSQSRSGAVSWLAAYDRMVTRLKSHADTCASAFECEDLDFDVRQILFKTRRGRVYRALFIIENNEVFILRVRGPGQAAIDADELQSP